MSPLLTTDSHKENGMAKILVDGKEMVPKLDGSAHVDKINADIVAAREDKSKWLWVEIPELDFYDRPFEAFYVNTLQFGPGKHFLEPELAGEVARIVKIALGAQRRLMSDRPDRRALKVADNMGGAHITSPGPMEDV